MIGFILSDIKALCENDGFNIILICDTMQIEKSRRLYFEGGRVVTNFGRKVSYVGERSGDAEKYPRICFESLKQILKMLSYHVVDRLTFVPVFCLISMEVLKRLFTLSSTPF
ncbi:unnamed protein product [Litomosoides sigmodontis]|uniref:Uncharacterized protein n=1 Tax=Litomosoides sigmodontis TaxID=42156 RepID=A0A3P6VCH0_LITSI|nr:unnamed protein product [Litomosoides sigmodontis]